MPIPRITYEALVRIFGEDLTRRYYRPVSVVRR